MLYAAKEAKQRKQSGRLPASSTSNRSPPLAAETTPNFHTDIFKCLWAPSEMLSFGMFPKFRAVSDKPREGVLRKGMKQTTSVTGHICLFFALKNLGIPQDLFGVRPSPTPPHPHPSQSLWMAQAEPFFVYLFCIPQLILPTKPPQKP